MACAHPACAAPGCAQQPLPPLISRPLLPHLHLDCAGRPTNPPHAASTQVGKDAGRVGMLASPKFQAEEPPRRHCFVTSETLSQPRFALFGSQPGSESRLQPRPLPAGSLLTQASKFTASRTVAFALQPLLVAVFLAPFLSATSFRPTASHLCCPPPLPLPGSLFVYLRAEPSITFTHCRIPHGYVAMPLI